MTMLETKLAEEIKVSRWGVGVLVTILLFIVVQTVAVVIWGARLTERVENMSSRFASIESSIMVGTQYRYTSEDASRDRAAMMQLLDAINQRVSLSEQRIKTLEEFHLRAYGTPNTAAKP